MHNCAIQAGTDNVVCWGYDGAGKATPPDTVNGVSGTATDIAAGGTHSCAIQAGTGNVVCWGDDSYGQATPPDGVNGVSGNATDIAAGFRHSCAIQAGTGDVVCWGNDYDYSGEYYYGQATPPDAVNGASRTAIDVAGGWFHTLAIVEGYEPTRTHTLPPQAGRVDRGERGAWKVSRDRSTYVYGTLGETVFENRSREDVLVFWGGAGCACGGTAYLIQQWVDGEWQHRPLPAPRICLACISTPIRVKPGQRLVQDFGTGLANSLPAVLRVNYRVGSGCGESNHSGCERSHWVPTRPFFVVEGDVEGALLQWARRLGTVDVIFGLGFPSNPTPEERYQALLAEAEMTADLAVFGVEMLPGTSIGALSVRANPESLQFLIEDPRVHRLRQRMRVPRVEDLPLWRRGQARDVER
jgi:hypothetical protein